MRLNNGNGMTSILQLLKGNPEAAFQQMMRNPQFAQFYNENKNLSMEQVAQKYGVNMNQINGLLQGLK